MLKYICFSLFVIFSGCIIKAQATGPSHGKAMVCYLASWSAYREGSGSFEISHINPSLCTHIVYVFAGLDGATNKIKHIVTRTRMPSNSLTSYKPIDKKSHYQEGKSKASDILEVFPGDYSMGFFKTDVKRFLQDPWLDMERKSGAYHNLVTLRSKHPHLKLIVAVGGWNDGSTNYSKMASSKETRQIFISSVMDYLQKYKFDGLDLHWKYPALRGGAPEDKNNHVELVKELKEAFTKDGYILTAAIGGSKLTLEPAYDLSRLSEYLDLMIVMCYDYHGHWDGTVGANAPLRGISDDDFQSLEYTIRYMLANGAKRHKIVLAVPLYGRTFILNDAGETHLIFGKTKVSGAFKGVYTGEDGFMGYSEICLQLKTNGSSWQRYWHDQTSTPYLRYGDRVISYDDERSIAKKVKMAIDYNLGGMMAWTIDTDDYYGLCERDADAFIDFKDRYHKMINDPLLNKALKNLDLQDSTSDKAYVMSRGVLTLRLPEAHNNYRPLVQTMNQVISMALEEKRILDEIKKVTLMERRELD